MIAGTQLSVHGDVIAEKTGVGRNWIGLILLATVTSLPELFTGVAAVTFNDLPDMAVSGTLGSCMFNMMVIASLDLLSRHRPVCYRVHQGHILSAGFGIVLVGLAAVDILCSKYLPVLTALNSIDPISLVYIVVYVIAMRMIYTYEKHRAATFAGELSDGADTSKKSLTRSVILFVLSSLFIVAAACYLPELGDRIGKMTGWSQSFIGSSFIAITTSLPEIAVSVAAAKMGSFDMAVANLLGSNLFNVVILAVVDFFYLKAPLLRSVSQSNVVTSLAAMIAMGIVVIGLTYRAEKKFLFLAGDAIAIALVYIGANCLLFAAH